MTQKPYDAVEHNVTSKGITPTGHVETYVAESPAAALEKLIYTRSLSNGKYRDECKIGPSGRTVTHGRVGYAVILARSTA